MLFNSAVFILAFLPTTWLGFFALGTRGYHKPAVIWLTLASLFFYGWWNPLYVPLLLCSMSFNYFIGRLLARRPSKFLLSAGVAVNLTLLGYYKYAGFLVQTANGLSGAAFPIPAIALPLAISFFTFQQIAFLVDSYDGIAEEADIANYSMFITFFPHLIAGPITHHKEMLPQFVDRRIFRPQPDLVALGLTLFLLGLCKKVIFADTVAQWVHPVFDTAAMGGRPDLFNAWGAALGYALQIYFDFSGYTDMAIGIGMLFGIRLPRNFDSPYKARNIIEYWSRWHMTLTRFLTAYIYNPMALRWARARMQAGKPVIKRGKTTPGAFLHLVATPTVLTMFLAGLWHGAGWQFIVFGTLHGFYLAINHAWRTLKAHRDWTVDSNRPTPRVVAVLTTFVCVMVALVFFRAANVTTALDVLGGMAFLHGAVLPFNYAHIPGVWHVGTMLGFSFGPVEVPADDILVMVGLLVIVWAFPNTQQWLRHFETSLGPQPKEPALAHRNVIMRRMLAWRPTVAFGVFVGCIGFFAL
ncbi:MAG: MBOAT family protein, partial [Pseudomonadota bacterium]|nr:MBOAT family protein [Pseudomonadota bacterium]